ncbi:hypothetical protein CY34DRAFT_88080, partial [Suillus luteus UH-Slu-Lm8-n1]
MQNLCYQAALRLAAHPKSHPLYIPVRKAAKKYVKRHRSSLHYLFHTSQIDIASIETITHSRRPPNDRNSYSTSIANSRKQAIDEHNANNDEIKIYCDGSGIDGKVGAAAVLYRQGQPRPPESLGLNLAAQLLSREEDVTYPISIYVDNQATIKSGELFSTKPGHYLIDHFCSAINALKK